MTAAVRIRVAGIVQGVGYRPFVWRLAQELGILGWVRNDARGVEIHAEAGDVAGFVARLKTEAPPLARVDAVTATSAATEAHDAFVIAHTDGNGSAATAIGPDSAVCGDCLADIFDPKSRRWRYAFTNCTNCGPRFTIIQDIPYDRPKTTMAAFELCPACSAEYHNPRDRRFHAQPNACAVCGPRLWLHDGASVVVSDDPVADAAFPSGDFCNDEDNQA